MMKLKLTTSLLCLVAPFVALPAHALVQDTSSDELEELESQHIDLDEIVVSANPFGRTLGQTITGVSLLDGQELQERLESSIGETLRTQPGISTTAFGAGASRPIIRGLGGFRVRVLEDGIGTLDVGSTSPDHAVPVEPALAERVEIFRGAASLLYGSSAAGGVVNTDTGKIPSQLPDGGIDGAIRYAHSTVNNGDEVTAGLNVALGNLVLHGEYFYRDADDYDIPGLAGSDALIAQFAADAAAEGEVFDPLDRFSEGTLFNSDLQSDGGAGGFSYIFDGPVSGFLGLSVSVFNTNYGVPPGVLTEEDLEGEEEEGGEEEGEEEGEEAIRIDLEQIRYDLKGEFNGDFGAFEKISVRLGYGDYRHFELEGDEIGTAFENDEIEGRLEIVSRGFALGGGEVKGAYGIQGRYRDFSAVGAEAFVPPSEQTQIGIFALHEYRQGDFIADLGLRYENVSNSTDTFVAEEDGPEIAIDESFNLFSVSAGAGYQFSDSVFAGVNVFRTQRAPALEELFSFGPHLATQLFEIGDPTLGKETATGVELSVRGSFGPLTTVINGYYTSYDDFIFEQGTGEVLDGLPVFEFTADDVSFRGFEAEADLELGQFDAFGSPVRFAAHAQADLVRASTRGDFSQDLPRIPPFSALLGLSATGACASFRVELEYAAEQDRVAAFEFPTDDFLFVNTFLTIRPFTDRKDISFEIRGRNLNNDEGRVHASFLKETAPLPGRDVRFAIRAAF